MAFNWSIPYQKGIHDLGLSPLQATGCWSLLPHGLETYHKFCHHAMFPFEELDKVQARQHTNAWFIFETPRHHHGPLEPAAVTLGVAYCDIVSRRRVSIVVAPWDFGVTMSIPDMPCSSWFQRIEENPRDSRSNRKLCSLSWRPLRDMD